MEVNESGQKKFLGKNISAGSKYFKKIKQKKKIQKKKQQKKFFGFEKLWR